MNNQVKKMLINASHPEELRVATVVGQRLEDIDIEHPNQDQKKSNIYLAVISRIEPSLEAVFVNYGSAKHGFLPLKEIEASYFLTRTDNPKGDIRRILKEGQELLIQVEKEERGNKGAALTTYISLAGRYLVLMPNNSRAGGISRRIEGDDREQMKQALNSLTIPNNMGVIVRTAGLGKNINDLQWDLDVLLNHWTAIKDAASSLNAPCLLHQESNIIIRAIRDNLRPDIKEILIDDQQVYQQANEYMELLSSDNKNIVKHYNHNIPIFTKFQIETQIEEAYQHEIRLPSGGSIVFDQTEALTAIDINSAQSTKGQDIENTALNTNVEASAEIARQLRLRDVGGLIVIDFIDMTHIKNQREVENKLRNNLQADRARIQLGRISKFGLLEMSRQRLKTSLGETTQVICSKCTGKGSIRTIESLSLSLLRIIEEESLKANTGEVQAQLPIELCTYLTNEKRENIVKIEKDYSVRVILLPNQYYDFPNYQINRIKSDEAKNNQSSKSYTAIEQPGSNQYVSSNRPASADQEVAAVQQININTKKQIKPSKPSLLKRLWSSLFDDDENTNQNTAGDRKHKKTTDRQSHRSRANKSSRNEAGANRTKDGIKDNSNRKRQNKQKRRTGPHNKNRQRNNNENTFVSNIESQNQTEQVNKANSDSLNKNIEQQNTKEQIPVQQEKRKDNQSKQPIVNEQSADNSSTSSANTPETNKKQPNRSQRNKRKNTGTKNKNDSIKTLDTNSSNNDNAQQKDKKNTTPNLSGIDIDAHATPASVFSKNTARTKIGRNDRLTKKRFMPKRKLPYEMDKSLNNNVSDSINKINDDLPIENKATEQKQNHHIETNVEYNVSLTKDIKQAAKVEENNK